MGSRGKILFDLNEPPVDDDDLANEDSGLLQPKRAIPSAPPLASNVLPSSAGPLTIANNHVFQHASSAFGFQPFVRPKFVDSSTSYHELKVSGNSNTNHVPTFKSNNSGDATTELPIKVNSADGLGVEKEEGEWSDAEGVADVVVSTNLCEQPFNSNDRTIQENGVDVFETNRMNNEKSSASPAVGSGPRDLKISNDNLQGTVKCDASMAGKEDESSVGKREVKVIEASHALRCANNLGNKSKLDNQKEAMLGKKRSRQTMFLGIDEVKQAGPLKSSTPRRQNFPSAVVTRIVKQNYNSSLGSENNGEEPYTEIQKVTDKMFDESNANVDSSNSIKDFDGVSNSGLSTRHKRQNSSSNLLPEVQPSALLRQGSEKHSLEVKQLKNTTVSIKKTSISQCLLDNKTGIKKLPSKKPVTSNLLYQDTSAEKPSVEPLIREVTSNNFWHHPEETEFQRVPGQFESVEEYVNVFEPLLFEECRAQLYNAWEELTETSSRDTHPMVRIKTIERRDRGWYDVVVLPVNDCKWFFKEGDVAVLSTPRPGSVTSKRGNSVSQETDEEMEVRGRVVGTVRRHTPIDTRDPLGAVFHFYVGDSYGSSSKVDEGHILNKLHPQGIWYLTVLGSLATTQREYMALHKFRRLHIQMQSAILQPSPGHFPKYEEQPPGMPECFTPNFVDHLHKAFNGPQLGAIKWAAMHTAAGAGGGTLKRQDSWPFTLVQGPPGTGKTHTVWGMLNVIHLVQYQCYYTALLETLAPESYKQPNGGSEIAASGSIDTVLQSMDQNLYLDLPKLCHKPRMLVCAPSNAATDELLTRVLDRGFIDGEMKIYRPDVARVGVDTQNRAAQAVSVERRTEQLLSKSREEILGWMQQLRNREAQLFQQVACLQRELNVSAAAGRSQGSVGVDPEVLLARDQNRDTLLQNLAAAVEARDKNLVELSRLQLVERRFHRDFNMKDTRAKLEASFANEAEIVFTTVSSSGRKLFSRLTHDFDMLVIDEAAQASEAAVLPPLSLGAARCVLVGDPQQLPATVISKAAGSLLYSRSLFERFQQAGCPTMLLSVQYRMHPQIRDFPSRHFYQGCLTDSESVVNLPDEKYYQDKLLKPYIFFDITHGRESHRGGSVSYQNVHEAQFCLQLYEHLQKTLKSLGLGKVSLGIITPYKLQLKCLQREFEDVLKTDEGKDIYINTVDAFQGQERDVIIMSCVRASSHGVGFVADIRRMNVALTRARRALWVMGNASTLMQCDDWAALIADAKTRGCYINMDSLPKDFLMSRSSVHTSPGKLPSHSRSFRSGSRHKFSNPHRDSRSGTQSEDEKPMNGNHRPSKPPVSK